MAPDKDLLKKYNDFAESKTLDESLAFFAGEFSGKAVFSSSLGFEDQALTHAIYSQKIPISIFTLDTGRLFQETYALIEKVREVYGQAIRIYFPDTKAVEALVNAKGASSFYESVDNRKECCGIRKVEPLRRALAGQKLWITGIRADQSGTRKDLPMVEWDESHQLLKFHPLLHWSLAQVKDYVKKNKVPYNPLHDKGFPSIGCAPCTRAIAEGEDVRAGRWWWELPEQKECGIHIQDGKIVRKNKAVASE
ncbi:MAG: phosphoadenylyl-sulfate reductase [Spirochaetia bacterium]|nr:phosphoadenylyl-sulfate reductase [Spirochaetia bacterium]